MKRSHALEESNTQHTEAEIYTLYQQILAGWNQRSSTAMAKHFAPDGHVIGFDGSQMTGPAEIEATLGAIFANHPTPPYVIKVREVRFLGPEVALLRAVVGMVPPGRTELEPSLNALQTLVAVYSEPRSEWQAALLQTTPAQFHGRPDLVQALTEELRQLLPKG